jgi:hypothetical protein
MINKILSYIVLTGVVIAGLTLLVSNAHGQQIQCYPYTTILEFMDENHGEQPHQMYVYDNGRALVVFFNEKTESWTAFIVQPAGVGCEVGSGTGYSNSFPSTEGDPS